MRQRTSFAVHGCAALALLIWVSTAVSAQEASVVQSPGVTAAATAEQVRFISFDQVTHARLEVFSPAGEMLFDSGFKPGDLLDWSLRDQQGQRLADGSYLCVVTVRDLSGRLSQRHGLVSLREQQVSLQRVAPGQLSAGESRAWADSRATQTLGATQESGDLEFIGVDAPATMTVVGHDGRDGQVTATAGALTFRTGDLFSGKEREQMRVTPDGRVGIGTDKPEDTLDVVGTIRARSGIRFDDGTVLTSAQGVSAAALSGTGTANKLAKWLDDTGTLGDSSILETNGLTVFGRQTPLLPNASDFHLVEMAAPGTKTPLVLVGGSGSMEFWKDTAGAGGGPTAATAFGMAVPGTAATNDIVFSTISGGAWGERLRIMQAGDLKLSGAGKGIIFPDGTKQTTAAAGSGGGVSGSGTSGRVPLWSGTTALGDSVVTQSAGNVGIGTTTPSTPLELVYNNNNIGFGFNMRNTNEGPQALVALSLNNAAGSRAGQFVYVPPTYMDVNMRDTLLLSSVGPATRLGIISASMAGGAPDIFFRAGGGNPNRLLIHGATGNVGVGTDAPAQRLDVMGNVKVTGAGNGIIFPDGSVQTTATVQGPAGPQGATGPQGLAGPQGPPGPAVRTVAICVDAESVTQGCQSRTCSCPNGMVGSSLSPCDAIAETGTCRALSRGFGNANCTGMCCVCRP